MLKFLYSTIILIALFFTVVVNDDCSDSQCLSLADRVETCDLCNHCNFQNTAVSTIHLKPIPQTFKTKTNFFYIDLSENNFPLSLFRPPIS